jgi:hypothetical protein
VPHLASDFSKVSLFIFKDRICPKLRISTIGDPTPKMARLRTPLARAKLEGRDTKNPQRYRHNEPIAAALGDPPKWLNETQAEAWRGFEAELPWLNRSHRCIVQIASVLTARMASGNEVGTKALSLLRLCLSSMGATPADSSKISWAPEEEPDDLLD